MTDMKVILIPMISIIASSRNRFLFFRNHVIHAHQFHSDNGIVVLPSNKSHNDTFETMVARCTWFDVSFVGCKVCGVKLLSFLLQGVAVLLGTRFRSCKVSATGLSSRTAQWPQTSSWQARWRTALRASGLVTACSSGISVRWRLSREVPSLAGGGWTEEFRDASYVYVDPSIAQVDPSKDLK